MLVYRSVVQPVNGIPLEILIGNLREAKIIAYEITNP